MTSFEWDAAKDHLNQRKHHVSFHQAKWAFFDPDRIIAYDPRHSRHEVRYYCIGKVDDGILTVRFTYRHRVIRIFGAGYWRKGKDLYEQENT
ncbi:MAG: BrnT family toxin [Candidatus Omnitrophota bacterium]